MHCSAFNRTVARFEIRTAFGLLLRAVGKDLKLHVEEVKKRNTTSINQPETTRASIKPEFEPPSPKLKSAIGALNEVLRNFGESISYLANSSMEARQVFEEAARLPRKF